MKIKFFLLLLFFFTPLITKAQISFGYPTLNISENTHQTDKIHIKREFSAFKRKFKTILKSYKFQLDTIYPECNLHINYQYFPNNEIEKRCKLTFLLSPYFETANIEYSFWVGNGSWKTSVELIAKHWERIIIPFLFNKLTFERTKIAQSNNDSIFQKNAEKKIFFQGIFPSKNADLDSAKLNMLVNSMFYHFQKKQPFQYDNEQIKWLPYKFHYTQKYNHIISKQDTSNQNNIFLKIEIKKIDSTITILLNFIGKSILKNTNLYSIKILENNLKNKNYFEYVYRINRVIDDFLTKNVEIVNKRDDFINEFVYADKIIKNKLPEIASQPNLCIEKNKEYYISQVKINVEPLLHHTMMLENQSGKNLDDFLSTKQMHLFGYRKISTFLLKNNDKNEVCTCQVFVIKDIKKVKY